MADEVSELVAALLELEEQAAADMALLPNWEAAAEMGIVALLCGPELPSDSTV